MNALFEGTGFWIGKIWFLAGLLAFLFLMLLPNRANAQNEPKPPRSIRRFTRSL